MLYKRKQASEEPGIIERRTRHLIQIYGTGEVIVESCRKILEYSEECVVLEGDKIVVIRGKGLRLKELGGGNLEICGTIRALEFYRSLSMIHKEE